MIEAKFTMGLAPDAKTIREAVFENEQGYKKEFDSEEAHCWNLVLYLDGQPIGTARLQEVDPATYRIGRVAVLKEYRGHKIGTYLVKFMLTKAKCLGALRVVLASQLDKVGFYRTVGFREDPDGEVFFEEGHPHIMMSRKIKKSYGHKFG